MTRKEYMEALESKLGFIPAAQRKAMLDYYEEMVEDRMEDGMDEASAVAAMESPDTIAKRLQAEGNFTKEEALAEDAENLTDEAMRFSSLAGSLLRTFEDLEKAGNVPPAPEVPEVPETQETPDTPEVPETPDTPEAPEEPEPPREKTGESSFQDSIQDFVHSAQEFAQSATRYFTPEPGAEQIGEYKKETYQCAVSAVRAIRLLCWEMPIRVTACEGNDLTLTYYTCDEDPYEVNLDDGALTLQRMYNVKSPSRFMFSVLGGVMRMVWNKPAPTVELLLPRNALVDLTAHANNASVKVSGCQALCETNLKTSNSRIEASDLSCMRLECASSNGRLVLTNIRTRQQMACKTSNSRIMANGLRSGGDMRLTTSNSHIDGRDLQTFGNLHLATSNGGLLAEDCAAKGELRLTTSNGRVETWRSQGASILLKTSNSSIRGSIPGTQSDWRIESHTSNGKNSLPKQQDGMKPLTVSTSNGSIDLGFEG
ncbi:MAG: DUF4097 family beta strand repeat protein [Clostridia bacterium]|nr:DUF4097 family beta strand repeat protein [Clostridia bacterium]